MPNGNHDDSQPLGFGTSGELGPLVACPLCGVRKGYTLHDGPTYRWWRVCCWHCGADVAECRSDGGTTLGKPKPQRWPAADHGWNEAGKHANELRQYLGLLADALEARIGTNAAEWSDVRKARALLERA